MRLRCSAYGPGILFLLLASGMSPSPPAAPPHRPQRPGGGVVGGVVTPQSTSPVKLASDWTLDERLALRCDPQSAAARVQGAQGRLQSNARIPFFQRSVDIISGRANPELFLPHELFETVVTGTAFDADWRRVYQPMLKPAGLPRDFWTRLTAISATYIDDLRAQRAAASDRSAGRALALAAKAAAQERRTCRDRALALKAARAEFGPALDRFMYQAVAPNRTDFLDAVSDARLLRAREEGCQ